jgi:hypothetical protein
MAKQVQTPASGTMPSVPGLPDLTAIQTSYRNRHPALWAVVPVSIASLAPNHDALSPVSFARNTVLGRLLSLAGRF